MSATLVEYPITKDLPDAFRMAVAITGPELGNRRPDPIVILDGKEFPIPAICRFAELYNDRLPDDLFIIIRELARRSGQKMPQVQTYKAGARALRSVYDAFRSGQP